MALQPRLRRQKGWIKKWSRDGWAKRTPLLYLYVPVPQSSAYLLLKNIFQGYSVLGCRRGLPC